MSGKISGIIFDVDGTILDSMHFWENSPKLYLKKLGIKTEQNFHQIFLSMTIEECSIYLKEKFNLDFSVTEIIDVILKCAEDFYFFEANLKGGILETLKFYESHGIPMIVATATAKKFVQKSFKRLGIDKYFIDYITTTEIGKGKNFPEIFLKCSELLGTPVKETLVVEDALHAIKTAKKAGFQLAGVYDNSSRFFQDEIKSICDFYYHDLKDMKVL